MTSSDEIGLVWVRRDLRLDDNPAWAAALTDFKILVVAPLMGDANSLATT